jgi:AcrR family transcriptional regulator
MANEQKTIIKKKHILESLKNLLENTVYSQISMEDVAAEAGLSKGGLRHYFPTKEELHMAFIEDFFNQIEDDLVFVMQGIDSNDKAFVSTLFGVERFMLQKRNIKLLINIILYGFEDQKILEVIQSFLRNQLKSIETIIKLSNNDSDDKDTQFYGRITQIILLYAGLMESLDPIKMDSVRVVEFLLKLSKGKVINPDSEDS